MTSSKCPLHAVDQRLADAHFLWHKANDSYFNPAEFRIHYQNLIQTLRTVTFVLQKHKSIIPDFDNWYGCKQTEMRGDPLLKWIIDSRNFIEKQGDLETRSYIRASIVASHLNEFPSLEIEAKLFENANDLFQRIPKYTLVNQVLKHGLLKIERRWIENNLPDYEILEALAQVYGKLALLINEAHIQMGLKAPKAINDETGLECEKTHLNGRLPCMIAHADPRSTLIHLANGNLLSVKVEKNKQELLTKEELEKRYGKIDSFDTKDMPFFEIAKSYFHIAQQIFNRDGYHLPIALIFIGSNLAKVVGTPVEDRQEKYLVYNQLAVEAEKIGADGLLFIGEVWTSTTADPKKFQYPVDMPDRKEMLTLYAINSNNERYYFAAEIIRNGESIKLGSVTETSTGTPYFLAPFYKYWGIDIPEQCGTSDTV